jgi:uncharacterized Zn finger protein
MKNGTAPHVDLSIELRPESLSALYKIANEFDFSIEEMSEVRTLAWLLELVKHLKDSSRNFPHGKWTMVKTLEQILARSAQKTVQIYYGNV